MGIKLLAVFIGGGLGSLLRFAISLLFPSNPNSFPWHTFMANMIACLLIGILLSAVFSKDRESLTYILLAVGLCGGFSTFSTFSVEGLQLIQNNQYSLAISYTLISILLGIGLSFTGLSLGQKLFS